MGLMAMKNVDKKVKDFSNHFVIAKMDRDLIEVNVQ